MKYSKAVVFSGLFLIIISGISWSLFAMIQTDGKRIQSDPEIIQTDEKRIQTDIARALELIETEYYQDVDPTTLDQSSLKNLLASLNDPYSYVVSDNEQLLDYVFLKGALEGFGFSLIPVEDKFIVSMSIPGSPAFEAGIVEGDALVSVNKKSVRELDIESAQKLLDVPTDTTLELVFSRNGIAKNYQLTASVFPLHTVFYAPQPNDIVYLRIIAFGVNTKTEIEQAVKRLIAEKPKGLILDLRGNGGGLEEGADYLLSQLIANGDLYTRSYGNGKTRTESGNPQALLADLPVAVLVDRGTASMAEVVAGALQDNQRAQVLGETTFGKALIWQIFSLPSGQSIHLTTGVTLTPKGKNIQGKGLNPDIYIDNAWENHQVLIHTAGDGLEVGR